MQHKAYLLRVNQDHTRYVFQSQGRRGTLEKVILLTPLSDDLLYNLALLDYDPINDYYDDLSISDNGDMPEIMATVIASIRSFLSAYPDRQIYFEGSTLARTRLYRIAITKVYLPETSDLRIQSFKDSLWLDFEPDVDFTGFLISKK
jgi:hypothetical protein